jgi:hypothetical protein
MAMPAGAYSIRPIPNAPSVLLFENETTKMQAIVFVRNGSSALAKPASRLMFTSGDREELANIVTDGWTYELSVHPAPKSLKGAALAITSSGR